ncbi:hypothetical protein [Paraburkholderia caribensis]|uniref:hypothetical protein n=1 Tax=Paraburkholderia caribensis TaxID=75105 RepID=UPI000B209AE6|nr:hypothetical protein [Paraburkholderia caribensis]
MTTSEKKTELRWVEIQLQDVLSLYVRQFEFDAGETLVRHDTFVDPSKGIVVFKLETELSAKLPVTEGTARPCPHCKGPVHHHVPEYTRPEDERHQFGCQKCGLETGQYLRIEDAVHAWNTME